MDDSLEETLRPTLELLSEGQVDRIVDQALELLATLGVTVAAGEARTLLQDAGVRVDGDRAYPQEEQVRAALATAPGSLRLYDRDGEPAAELVDRNVCFVPGSTALHVLDRESRRRRPATSRDAVHLAWVTEEAKHIGAQSTAVVPSDVPDVLADRYRLYLALKGSRKPIVTGTFRVDGFAVMKDLLAVVRGGEEALRAKPLAIFDCCSTSPLAWSGLGCRALVDCARSGIPAELISVPMAGATAPVTVREMVVAHCAESLSGLLIHQLAVPGAPVVYGGAPTGFDMRHGTPPMAAVEAMMANVAAAQIGRRLCLPTHAYMGLADAKLPDYQGGAESSLGMALAALAGINMVAGAGMLAFVDCQSPEKLLLDDAAAATALHLAGGIRHASAGDVPELFAALVESRSLLGHRHTRRNFRRELLMPGEVIDRRSYGDWEKDGGRDAFEAAAAEVDRILEAGNPAPLDAELERQLDRLIRGDAERHGFGKIL